MITEKYTHSAVDPEEDPLLNLYSAAHKRVNYREDETGVYHPVHHQTLKMRSNGMIDLFTHHDTGFRIDPHTQSINAFADHMKYHVSQMTAWVTGDYSVYAEGQYLIKAAGKILLVSKDQIAFRVGETTKITVSEETIRVHGDSTVIFDGNVNAIAKQDVKMNVDKNLQLKARGDISIESGGELRLRGATTKIGNPKADHNAAHYEDYYETDKHGRQIKKRRVIASGDVFIGG